MIADLLSSRGIERLVTLDLHCRAVEIAFSLPVEHRSAVPLLAEAVRPAINQNTVIVSPDLGAAKMAEQYANILNLPVACIHKTRISGEQVKVQRSIAKVDHKKKCCSGSKQHATSTRARLSTLSPGQPLGHKHQDQAEHNHNNAADEL